MLGEGAGSRGTQSYQSGITFCIVNFYEIAVIEQPVH
jgi:hypothetical protein